MWHLEHRRLAILHNASARSAFTQPQLAAIAFSFTTLRSAELAVVEVFSGLWLLPLGILIMRSGFIPTLVGVLLVAGHVGWLLVKGGSVRLPDAKRSAASEP